MDKHLAGSPEVWDELFSTRDLSYSEKADTQGKLFEKVKTSFLEKLFKKNMDSRFRGNDNKTTPYTLHPVTSLEVGCGTAYVSLYFAKRGFKATCLDSSKEVLKIAESNFKKEGLRPGGGKAEFIVGDAGKLPFKDNSFDVVMSFGLLEHFSDPSIAIDEMARVLSPGGVFFADIVPARFSVQSLGNVFNALAAFAFYFMKGKPRVAVDKFMHSFYPEYYENSISWQDYKKIIEKAGLKGVQVKGNRPWPRLTLPKSIDKYLYTPLIKLSLPFWWLFDNYGGGLAKFWGAGWWVNASK